MHTLLLHEKVKVYKDILKFVSLNQIIELKTKQLKIKN